MSTSAATRPSGCTIWFTGMSGAGKTTVARLARDGLAQRGLPTELLDGDALRETMGKADRIVAVVSGLAPP